jgi:DNA-binding IclR family transcriptional regulator
MTAPESPASNARERNPVGSIVRVLDAMVASEAPSFGVRELARLLDAPPSSVQRTLEAGAAVSLVSPTASGQWELGWELYRIASLAQRKRPFSAAADLLDALSDLTGETAFLAIYDGQRRERMYVAMSPSTRSVQFVPQLFTWLPLQATASAMAILAHRSEQERRALYEAGLPVFAKKQPAPATIEKMMASIRSEGLVVSRDQADVGASAIAAPIWTARAVQGSVGVGVPNQRFTTAHETELAGHVTRVAQLISRRLGDPLSALDTRSPAEIRSQSSSRADRTADLG